MRRLLISCGKHVYYLIRSLVSLPASERVIQYKLQPDDGHRTAVQEQGENIATFVAKHCDFDGKLEGHLRD